MHETYKKRWSTGTREKITDISKGISEILAGLAEPLMRYSTIYLALATSIKVIYYAPAYNATEAIVIAAPEFVLLGAFTIAETSIAGGQKKWGYILLTICLLLAAIMIATFVDIFIITFNDLEIHILNFSRCLVALGFSVALGKLEQPAPAEKSTGQSQGVTVKPEPEKKPEPVTPAPEPQAVEAATAPESHQPEPENDATDRDTRSQEERLETAYQQLLREGGRISGRALAPLAHVNRTTATKWLEARTGASSEGQSHPEPVSINQVRARYQGRKEEVVP